ncbi:conserved hypothetical protein [Microsporum canis CBS 113480]|uniref:Uncharacterized protein n=1 Tax=Arthroderma otae (strain ATCC MYA-4605 / CBS 113480) TaxID=554155 RepID=C5FZR2_ARTOC|nr:conserved hypothetical protein [Microsporum canis CBS 113480]EEQ35365.1 conserved hypothetical protein [Microsporum canis CBS 113480]
MSAGLVLSQLEGLVSRAESLSSKLTNKKIRPTNGQQDEFQKLSKRMDSAWATVSAILSKFKHRSDKDINLANAVRATQEYQTITSPIFMILRRNLELIFVGPRGSALDSAQVKTRKKKARTRCELLRSQHPHVILMWAMAIPPSSWNSSVGMSDNTFDFVIDDTSTERIPLLSTEIVQKLQSLEEEKSLNTCDQFREFMSSLKSTLIDQRENANALKRSHGVMELGTENKITTAQDQLPSLRQMGFTAPVYNPKAKYIYSNAPASNIEKLPEPFRTAVRNSKLWEAERRQGLETTGCLATLLPKDDTQDVSLTIWCANEDGYRLHRMYGMEVAMSF